MERRVYVKNSKGIFHHIENAMHFQRKKLCFFLGQENATAFSLVIETPHFQRKFQRNFLGTEKSADFSLVVRFTIQKLAGKKSIVTREKL